MPFWLFHEDRKEIEKEKKCVEIIGKHMNEYFLFFFIQQETHVMRLRYCLLYTSPSPRDKRQSRMPSSA